MYRLGPAALLIASTLLATTGATAQPNLLQNGTFSADLDGWTLPNEPGVDVVWHPFGNPSGSMRVAIDQPNTTAGVYSLCISGPPGRYTVRGSSYRAAGEPALMICRATIRGWTLPNCQGSMVTLGQPGPPALDQWVDWEYVQFLGELSSAGIESIVVDLSAERLRSTGETTCYFDNIALTGPIPSSLEIPTLSELAITLLATLLAASAIGVLRRGR